MQTTVIDTLRYANNLKKAGVEPRQAEAMSRAINDELTEGVATKRDLDDAVVELKGETAKLDSRFDAMEAGLDVKFEAIDSRFEALDSKFEGILLAMDAKFEAKFEAIDSRFDALDSKFEVKFEALDSKFEALDSKLENKTASLTSTVNALSDKVATQSRYTFLVFALIIALGLYNAASPHFVKPPASAPAAQTASSPE